MTLCRKGRLGSESVEFNLPLLYLLRLRRKYLYPSEELRNSLERGSLGVKGGESLGLFICGNRRKV